MFEAVGMFSRLALEYSLHNVKPKTPCRTEEYART